MSDECNEISTKRKVVSVSRTDKANRLISNLRLFRSKNVGVEYTCTFAYGAQTTNACNFSLRRSKERKLRAVSRAKTMRIVGYNNRNDDGA